MLPFHPYADIFPLIQGEEFAGLVADIKANGLRERIIVLDGSILDGRNRYRAAIAAGIIAEDELPTDRPLAFQRLVPDVDGDPLKFVISKNLYRRHLDDRQRASVAAKIANLSRAAGDGKPPIGGLTAEQAADSLNVAPRQVERARVVHGQGVPELRHAIDRGALALSVAEQIARMPEAEQPEALAKVLPNGARSIMSSRQEPDDSLDYFPTPPWATRALAQHVLPACGLAGKRFGVAWEPACGEGHIAEALAEYSDRVIATDVFDYGYGTIQDFLEVGIKPLRCDWLVTNSPFGGKAIEFVLRSLAMLDDGVITTGVAMFFRSQWAVEGIERYEEIFCDRPPTLCAFFVERVNLCKGRWDPEGSTATAYCWLVWVKGAKPRPPFWIPPGCREALTHPDDVARFTSHPVIRRENFDPTTGEIKNEDEAA